MLQHDCFIVSERAVKSARAWFRALLRKAATLLTYYALIWSAFFKLKNWTVFLHPFVLQFVVLWRCFAAYLVHSRINLRGRLIMSNVTFTTTVGVHTPLTAYYRKLQLQYISIFTLGATNWAPSLKKNPRQNSCHKGSLAFDPLCFEIPWLFSQAKIPIVQRLYYVHTAVYK